MFNNQPAKFLKNSSQYESASALCICGKETKTNKFLTHRRKYKVISENCWGGSQDKNAAKFSA